MEAHDVFKARLEEWRANGLVDIKFFVSHEEKMTTEDLFVALNKFHDAIDAGEFEQVDVVETLTPAQSGLLQA